jgi:diguanylate cyclase (GGDEF)-like protein
VAGLTSGDRSANRTIEGQRHRSAPASELLPLEQTRADLEQTLADRDQTLADADQTAADSDQAAADNDQAAADSDQAASDHDLAHGGDRNEHGAARDLRERSALRRQQGAQGRVEAANARDAAARARDLAASARDAASALRDRELAASDAGSADGSGPMAAEAMSRSAHKHRGSEYRIAAVESRARAAADREQAARDREQAARDRLQAQLDREALLQELEIAETDALTGARTRAAGLTDFGHEIDRARRATKLLAVGYVDVVGLKAVNDAHGHSAGDALLARTVRAIRSHLRSYDLIVRLGGDEFLCAMSGATMADARQRFDAIQAALANDADPCEIKVGFAALEPEDSATELIERADAKLPRSRPR